MQIQIRNDQKTAKIPAAKVRRLATTILRSLKYADVELSISLVTDEEIRGLNRAYLNRDRPTNVLAFAQAEGAGPVVGPRLLGDVVVSTDTATAQAARSGLSVESEVAYLLIHGVLHLVGYEHEDDPADAKAMRKLQNELFAQHGDLLEPEPSNRRRKDV